MRSSIRFRRGSAFLAVALVAAGCNESFSPGGARPNAANLATSGTTESISGTGTLGTDPAVPGAARQDFDLDVNSVPSGRLAYKDWSVLRPDGTVGTLTVSPTDTMTGITAFRDGSNICPDPSRGVEFDGVGRVNTGGDTNPSADEFLTFTIKACDNAGTGGPDMFYISVPGHGYTRGPDDLASGDLTKSVDTSTATTGNLVVSTSTSGSNLDPDGYTVTVDGASQPVGTNASVTFTGLASGSHSVTLSGVAGNCSVSGGSSQAVNVPAGGTANVAYSVSCTADTNQAPTVNAGPDESVLVGLFYTTSASFSDPGDAGPWTYTIEWGDGSRTTGTTSDASKTIGAAHSYLLLGAYTIRVTVVDSGGLAGSDSKVLTVVL